jgi:hypothetical protein
MNVKCCVEEQAWQENETGRGTSAGDPFNVKERSPSRWREPGFGDYHEVNNVMMPIPFHARAVIR